MISLKIDTTKVHLKLDGLKKSVPETLAKELNRFGQLSVGEAKRLAPNDESTLIQRISFEPATPQDLKVSVVCAVFYAAYIEFGTRRFGAAYVSTLPQSWQAYAATFKGKAGGSFNDFIQNIMAWVQRKGIGADTTKSGNVSSSASSLDKMQQAAYWIALNILQNGIKPHPFMYPAITKEFIELKKRLA